MASNILAYARPGHGKVKAAFWESTGAAALLANMEDAEERTRVRQPGTVFHAVNAIFGAPVHTGEAVALRDVYSARATQPGGDGDLAATTFYVPMTQFDMDPRHFPTEAAPDTAPPAATAATGATQLYTTVSPTDIVVAPFRPFDNVDVFEAAARRELTERHQMRQPVDVQVGQVLAVLDPAVSRSMAAAGARGKSLADLFALLRARHPTAVSGAAKRAQLGRNRWTNSEDAVTNMDQLEADWIETHGLSTWEAWATQAGGKFGDEVHELGSALLDSLPPYMHEPIAQVEDELKAACKDYTSFRAITAFVTKITASRTRRNKAAPGAGVFNVRPAAPDVPPTWANDLFEHIKALEGKMAALTSTPPPFTKSKKPFDSKVAKRPCRHCTADPKSVDGGAVGQHWDSECPDKN